jgi:hypothetical protein
MSQFLDVIRDPRFALRGEGPMSSLAESGYTRQRAENSRRYKESLMEAARLVKRVLEGDRYAGVMFREALTTSDFPNLFGDILDRQVLANYLETPYTWSQYCKRGTIQDFRQAKRFRVDRGAAVLDGPIVSGTTLPGQQTGGSGSTGLAEITEYPERRRTDAKYVLQLYKYGARMPFSWETIINDDLDALKDTPALFGRAARRTEEKKVTELYVSATGPNSTFFTAPTASSPYGNANLLSNPNSAGLYNFITTNNPILSITSLAWAMYMLSLQRDLDGEPIDITAVTLVVPPQLKIIAMNVLNATQIFMNDQGGTTSLFGSGATQSATSAQRLLTENWAKNIVRLAVDYYLPIVDTTSGNTAWYLFADPNLGRPAMEMAFLRGHEQPELFMKLPNQVAIGEGRMGPGAAAMGGTTNTNPLEGDFDTDAIHYKVRHVMGGTLLDPIMAIASKGTGTT